MAATHDHKGPVQNPFTQVFPIIFQVYSRYVQPPYPGIGVRGPTGPPKPQNPDVSTFYLNFKPQNQFHNIPHASPIIFHYSFPEAA